MMSYEECEALYEALKPAIKDTEGRAETDWFILMAAQHIAHERLMQVKYPETYPRPVFA